MTAPSFPSPLNPARASSFLQDPPADGSPDPQAEIRGELHGLDGRVVFPFRVNDEPLGFLLIGDKQNGGRISTEEVRLLSALSENVSLVVNQISLKNQIARAQELELIGRMSQGMAHDLKNLTTPISTLIQLLEERGEVDDLMRDELIPVSKRNMEKMCAYISESLFFTDRLCANLKPLRLDEFVRNIVTDAIATKRKGKTLRYEIDLCGEVLATLDAVLTQRLLTNLIANAIDASDEGGLIGVALDRLKTEHNREWVRISITDQGCGIPLEIQKRIFEPYFTTKKTGDGERGFGLGLAICKKIATLQGCSLVLSSKLGTGTTFLLDIPCRPLEPDTNIVTPQFRAA